MEWTIVNLVRYHLEMGMDNADWQQYGSACTILFFK
jgi:hypothetical protein